MDSGLIVARGFFSFCCFSGAEEAGNSVISGAARADCTRRDGFREAFLVVDFGLILPLLQTTLGLDGRELLLLLRGGAIISLVGVACRHRCGETNRSSASLIG